MDRSEKLVFFNNDEYPYNLQYNLTEQRWEGKIYFDENSSGLYKTICLYIFEQVDAFDFTADFDFESSQLYNWSGITFIGETYKDQSITNIEKVNADGNFNTKWIYGNDFDIKFRSGSIVSFSGDTSMVGSGWGDFTNTAITYSVMGTKKDAILLSTETDNLSFTGFSFTTGLTLTSHNIIKVADLGGTISIDDLHLFTEKKLVIDNSYNNDGIYTYIDNRILKNKFYDFYLQTGLTGTLELDFTFYTERPKLYTGPVNIVMDDTSVYGTTVTFYNDINNDLDFFNTGQTMIFEEVNGDPILDPNPEFTITGYLASEDIVTTGVTFRDILSSYGNRYYIILEGTVTGLTNMDRMRLVAQPFTSGLTFHQGRSFDIIEINYDSSTTTIEVEQYVINETGHDYKISKLLKRSEIQTLFCQQSIYSSTTYTGTTNCFSTSNTMNISQSILLSGDTEYYYDNTIDAINIRYETYLRSLGIVLYHLSGTSYLIIQGIFDYNYTPYFDVTASINGVTLSSGSTFGSETNIYHLEVEEELNNYEILSSDNNSFCKNYSAEIKFDLNDDILHYGFKIILNNVEYSINYSSDSGSTSYTHMTIIDFIYAYYDVFSRQGFILSDSYVDGYYALNIDGIYPDLYVEDLKVKVNIFSTYILTEVKNTGIVITSNLIRALYGGLYNLELATGTIISISGSKYALNNKEYNIIKITDDIIQLSYEGPFFDESGVTCEVSVREFIRKPRSYYDQVMDYKFSWAEPEEGETITDDIFFYDFSGEQLVPYNNITSLTYTGVKPLISNTDIAYINTEPNKSESQVNNPLVQQTVFDDIKWRLETLNDSDAYDYTPEPMEVFIGFSSEEEGVKTNILTGQIIEYIVLSGETTYTGNTTFEMNFLISGDTIECLTNDYLFNFNSLGFYKNQLISIDLEDNSCITGQTLYDNYGTYRIKDVTAKKIFIDTDYSGVMLYFNSRELYLNSGKTFDYVIKTEPREFLRCSIYGQTEIEDERLDINLRNLGIDIFREAELIFKESDIDEQSVDYMRLNRKRKEMLSIYTDIFNYVGSYRALINAINYFGYNDLELYEYYRNIKLDSPLYGKLQKILVQDIFDNTVTGWSSSDFIQNKYNKGYYKKTNLFNLTYRITDNDGNYVHQYSLDDVQTKLMALVKWLRQNVVPLSSNIRDITGVGYVNHDISIRHDTSVFATKYIVEQENVAVNFNYTTTLIDRKSYLFTINFYVLSGCTAPDFYTVKIKTYSIDTSTAELIPQQYFDVFKTDYLPYSFNLNSDVDPIISIEITSFNGYGGGYNNSKMFKFDEGKNFILINSNFNATSFAYLNSDNAYYIIEDGRYYVVEYPESIISRTASSWLSSGNLSLL